MRNCVILLVNSYPYSGGEDFLIQELPTLSERFEKIYIFARDASVGDSVTRPVPQNAECYPLSGFSDKVQKKLSQACGFALSLLPGRISADEKHFADTAAKRAFHEYFELRAADGFRSCLSRLDMQELAAYDRVVIYSYWLFVTAKIGAMLRDKLKSLGIDATLISRAHRYDLYEEANSLGYLPERRGLLGAVDGVYVCSENGRKYLSEKHPDFLDKIHTAVLGSADMGECGHGRDEFHIVSCSGVTARKRVGRIASSLALLRDSGLSLRWTHIGDGDELEALRRYANEELDFVKTDFKGFVPNPEVYEFYKNNNVNLFINVSENEGLPVSVMEASSFGIPAVVTDVGGSAQAVCGGVSGTVIPSDFSDEQLAFEIKRFAVMPESEYSGFCSGARRHWSENFCAQRNYESFWDSILNAERTVSV